MLEEHAHHFPETLIKYLPGKRQGIFILEGNMAIRPTSEHGHCLRNQERHANSRKTQVRLGNLTPWFKLPWLKW